MPAVVTLSWIGVICDMMGNFGLQQQLYGQLISDQQRHHGQSKTSCTAPDLKHEQLMTSRIVSLLPPCRCRRSLLSSVVKVLEESLYSRRSRYSCQNPGGVSTPFRCRRCEFWRDRRRVLWVSLVECPDVIVERCTK